jgi:hypothetical protein
MGKVSKGSTAEPIEGPGFEGRYGETEGYTIGSSGTRSPRT